MNRYLMVIEKANGNFSGYSPDVPGCVATGASREEVEKRMDQALRLHLRGLRDDGLPLPEPLAPLHLLKLQRPNLDVRTSFYFGG